MRVFQSTRPVPGAICEESGVPYVMEFQSRRPHSGATFMSPRYSASMLFQSTRPKLRSRQYIIILSIQARGRNDPRTNGFNAHAVTYLIFGVKSFQFHVPRAGRDARLSISKIQPGWAKPRDVLPSTHFGGR